MRLLENRLILSRRDYTHGDKHYRLVTNKENDLKDAVTLASIYPLEQIQEMQIAGNELLREYGKALKEYRTTVRRHQRCWKSLVCSILAPFIVQCRAMADREMQENQMKQLLPARCFRMLEILDIAEGRLKDAVGA